MYTSESSGPAGDLQMSLAACSSTTSPPQRDSMWLLSHSQISFQSVAMTLISTFSVCPTLLQRIGRCNIATLPTHFCLIRVIRAHSCLNHSGQGNFSCASGSSALCGESQTKFYSYRVPHRVARMIIWTENQSVLMKFFPSMAQRLPSRRNHYAQTNIGRGYFKEER